VGLKDDLEPLRMGGDQLAEEGYLLDVSELFDVDDLRLFDEAAQLLVGHFEEHLFEVSIEFHLFPQLCVVVVPHMLFLELVLQELDD
jgi:hypothetical protein